MWIACKRPVNAANWQHKDRLSLNPNPGSELPNSDVMLLLTYFNPLSRRNFPVVQIYMSETPAVRYANKPPRFERCFRYPGYRRHPIGISLFDSHRCLFGSWSEKVTPELGVSLV